MVRKKTVLQKSIGKLISTIQKEWENELGKTGGAAEKTENVMDAAHDLLQAKTSEKVKIKLNGVTVKEYLGSDWVESHPRVIPFVDSVQQNI